MGGSLGRTLGRTLGGSLGRTLGGFWIELEACLFTHLIESPLFSFSGTFEDKNFSLAKLLFDLLVLVNIPEPFTSLVIFCFYSSNLWKVESIRAYISDLSFF